MRFKLIWVLIALVPGAFPLQAQGPSHGEKELVRSIQARLADEEAALEKVVNIDSGTFNLAGVRELGRYFQKELEALGFRTRWVEMPEAMHRAGHLVAERVAPEGAGKRVLLIGHLDTIFEGEGNRFKREGEKARGAGVADMKGGDIIILYALKALHGAGSLEGATVRVFLTGDEENPGTPTTIARGDLIEAARQSDVAVSFEADMGKVLVARRGLSTWSLEVTGVQGHSAFVLRPKGGAGAIYEASRILDGFRRTYSVHPTVTVNPGLFVGGTEVTYDADRSSGTSAGKFNVVAKAVTVNGDLRYLSSTDRDEAKARMLQIAKENLPKTSATLAFDDVVPGWPPTEGNKAMLAAIDVVSRDLGQGPLQGEDPVARGFGDFNYIGSLVSGVDGVGVKGDGIHGPDESMDPKSLGPCTARAAVLVSRLLQQLR